MQPDSINAYWQQFLHSIPAGNEKPAGFTDAFHFADKADATAIAALVVAGIKTATGSLLWVYEAEQKTLPQPGDYNIITDGNDVPVCIIVTTEVRIIPFNEVDEAFAYDGGEGDRSLEDWQSMYNEYIQSECLRINRSPDPAIPMVCERFKVVYKELFLAIHS